MTRTAIAVSAATIALACGGETSIGQTRSTDGRESGGRSATGGARNPGGETETGGALATGGNVAIGGSGGASSSSGGARSTGGDDNTGGRDRPLPDGPEWQPPFPVGTPGWRDSKERFCPSRYGPSAGPQVWSDAAAVFAAYGASRCPLDPRDPCGGEGRSIYANEGSGWVRILDEESEHDHSKLRGFPGGPLVVYAGEGCNLRVLDRGGALSRCLWSPADGDHLFSVSIPFAGEAYALTSSGKVLLFDAETWSERASLDPAPDPPANRWLDVFAGSLGAVVSGRGGQVAHVWQNGDVTMGSVGTADIVAAWEFDVTDTWVATSEGTLLHYEAGSWIPLEASHPLDIRGIWGSPERTVFFYTPTQLGRAKDGKLEIVADLGDEPARFSSLWGNSDAEVFVGIDHGALDEYRCSGAFVAWFDGERLHLF